MSDSLIPSFLVNNVSESLRSLTKNDNERPWAICSKKFAKKSKILFFSKFKYVFSLKKWAIRL